MPGRLGIALSWDHIVEVGARKSFNFAVRGQGCDAECRQLGAGEAGSQTDPFLFTIFDTYDRLVTLEIQRDFACDAAQGQGPGREPFRDDLQARVPPKGVWLAQLLADPAQNSAVGVERFSGRLPVGKREGRSDMMYPD